VLCFPRGSGFPPDADVPLPTRREVRLHLFTDNPQQRHVGGNTVHGPLLPTSTLLPLAAAHTRRGENPKWVGRWPAEARPWGVGTRLRRRKGKVAAALGDWTRATERRRGRAFMAAKPLSAWFRRETGSFPPGDSLGERARAAAQRPGQPGGAAVPSNARAGAARRDAARCDMVLRRKRCRRQDKGDRRVGPICQQETRK
jgi:hypothetical protein